MKFEYCCEDFRTKMHKLWKAGKCCDVVLIGNDEKTRIPTHRLVLEAYSSYFAGQTADAAGNTVQEIVVDAIDGATLERLVDMCYSGKLEVDQNSVSRVYMGAVHLQLNSLLVTMDNYIMAQMNIANCLRFREIAEMSNRSVLLKATGTYICKHFTKITDHASFLELDTKRLQSLLAVKGLIVKSAEDMFRNVIKWVQHDPTGQRNLAIAELLPNLRLSSMSQKFLLGQVKPHCKTFEALELVIAAIEAQFEFIPVIPTDVKRQRLSVDADRERLIVVAGKNGGTRRSEIMEYSFERQNWITLAELPTEVHNFSITYSIALNSLCFVGGSLKASSVRDVLFWNLKSQIFTKSKSMIQLRAFAGVTSLYDGDLIVAGGWNGTSLSNVERWSYKSSKWQLLAPTKYNNIGARLVTVGNFIYCIGGNYIKKSVECYNLTTKHWSIAAPFKHKREDFGALVDKGKIYIIGGGSSVIECYDPDNNKWTEVCTAKHSETVRTCIRHNKRLFAFGWKIVLISDGHWKIWKKSDSIDPIDAVFYGAFSIKLK